MIGFLLDNLGVILGVLAAGAICVYRKLAIERGVALKEAERRTAAIKQKGKDNAENAELSDADLIRKL